MRMRRTTTRDTPETEFDRNVRRRPRSELTARTATAATGRGARGIRIRDTTPRRWMRSPNARASASRALPAFPGARTLPGAARRSVGTLMETVRDALGSNADPKQRVAATFGAYFGTWAARAGLPADLQSDLSNRPAVRDRLDRVQRGCAEMVSRRSGKTPDSPATKPPAERRPGRHGPGHREVLA